MMSGARDSANSRSTTCTDGASGRACGRYRAAGLGLGTARYRLGARAGRRALQSGASSQLVSSSSAGGGWLRHLAKRRLERLHPRGQTDRRQLGVVDRERGHSELTGYVRA